MSQSKNNNNSGQKQCQSRPWDLPEGPLPGRPDWIPAPHKTRNAIETRQNERLDVVREADRTKGTPPAPGCEPQPCNNCGCQCDK